MHIRSSDNKNCTHSHFSPSTLDTHHQSTQEYSEWLAQSVRSPGFHLPWAIEGDRVGSLSIRFMLAKDKNWTKALKYMLVDLKFCLKATIALNSSGGAAADEGAEGGARAPLGRGQRVGPLGRLDTAAAGQ